MDGSRFSVSPKLLYARLSIASAPLVIDVRRRASFDADDTMVASAVRRSPEEVERWRHDLPPGRQVVAYRVHGQDVSQGVAAALRVAGIGAIHLAGGITGWAEQKLPRRKKIGAIPGKWVTRERPKVDRIACPWLSRRFIDPEADILYAPADRVLANVEFGHEGGRCSFDAFLRRFGIEGADTGHLDLTPQSPGLLALAQGLSATPPDDGVMLASGMILYDALSAWCRQRSGTASQA
jgi:rhodanese-related sulfurtransferase